MKTTSFRFILAALAATVALAGCVQEITPPNFENDKVAPASEGSRVIAVSFGKQQTKTTLGSDGLQPKFEDGKDTVLISNTNALDTCVVSVDDKTGKATISTNLTGPLTAVYPYKAAKRNESNLNQIDTVLVSTVQSGKFADANICMAQMLDGKDESLSFENKTAVFCIYPPTDNPEYVEVSAKNSNIANNVLTGSEFKNYDKIHVATTTADSAWVSILVPGGLKVSDLTFSDGTNVKSVTTGAPADKEIEAGTLYTVTNENWESTEDDTPEGAIKGEFTVNAQGKKVYFSKGNLYAKNEGTEGNKDWKWHFYDEQYQYNSIPVDDSGVRTATNGDTEIDLFTWGYDGDSTHNSYSLDPINTAGIGGHTTISDNQLNPSTDGDDWGVAYCSSNNITVGTWRTLTTEEWQYLFNTRTFNNGANTGKGYSYQGATINSDATGGGVYGMILYPDDYTSQTGATSYISAEWATMEQAGCVFLPAAGDRGDSDVWEVGDWGYYWSSTAFDDSKAFSVELNNDDVERCISDRGCGFSVRLVTDVSAAPTPTQAAYVEITAKYDGEGQPARALKWATKNLGAETETDYGKYYAWGDIEGQAAATSGNAFEKAFNWANCPFNNGSSVYNSSYFNTDKQNEVCPGGVLKSDYDVANKVLGGTWRMPTKEEFDALCNLTNEWKANYNNSGVNGYLFTDENGHSIFLPAAGYGYGTSLGGVGDGGYYWSSSLNTDNPDYACYLDFNDGNAFTDFIRRYYGQSVRALSE